MLHLGAIRASLSFVHVMFRSEREITMRRWMMAALVSVALAGSVQAKEWRQPLSGAEEDAIRAAVSEQIAAFESDNAERAFSLASPGIQMKFGSAGTFLDVVKRRYAPVYRPQLVRFGPVEASPHGPVQLVDVVGPRGRSFTAAYVMERQDDDTWRIAGCVLLQRRDLTI